MFGEGEPVDEFVAFFKEVAAKFPDVKNFGCWASATNDGWKERLKNLKELRSGEVMLVYLPGVSYDEFVLALRSTEGLEELFRSGVHRMADKGVLAWFRK